MALHWSWWVSGAALAMVPILHWVVLDRAVAVSGRYTALVDRLRFGKQEEQPEDAEALIAAIRAQTAAELGDGELEDPDAVGPVPAKLRSRQSPIAHLLFLVGLGLGGLISALLGAGVTPTSGLRGETFAAFIDGLGVGAPVVLLVGGMFVGFGTRMAAGCTSGHGLCGVSQLQPGSLLSTAAFFGAGVATSFALGALL